MEGTARPSRPPPLCPYCSQPAVFSPSSSHIYGNRDYGPVYECAACDAWTFCRKTADGILVYGTLADAPTRKLRTEAHKVFDRLWRAKMRRDQCSKREARAAGYRWLAARMGLSEEDCHMSRMQAVDLLRVINICTEIPLKPA